MAVGQFFNPEEGNQDLSPWFMLQSTYFRKELLLEEAHPLVVKLSFSISSSLLPVTLSVNNVSCGIRNSELPEEEAGDIESGSKKSNPLPVGQFLRILCVMIRCILMFYARGSGILQLF
ncbi:uncharacterized protein [Cicer arietinum]|uniref:uncharacterized protein n=1 Tax=Cicer arietinum TaxID=3827 RepID=UPI003CC548AF